jgi:hypothetical protein
MRIDVFISYATENRPLAADLAQFLQEKGYFVWWDRDLIAGEGYPEKIRAALEDCKVAIVIWTTSSIRSRWVLEESEIAASGGKLVPVRADSLPVDQLPLGFRTVHTIALSNRLGLLDAIAAHFNTPPIPLKLWDVVRARAARRFQAIQPWLTWRYAALAAALISVAAYLGIEAVDWRRIHDSVEAHDFERHLRIYPVGIFAAQARTRLSGEAEWNTIKASRSIAEIQDFTDKFPHSIYRDFARLRLARLQAVASGKLQPLLPDSANRAVEKEELKALNCEQLWRARNEIFYALGYCFETDAAIESFRTLAECPYDNCQKILKFNALVREQVLSRIEDGNVTLLRGEEKEKGCRISSAPKCVPRR